MKNDYLLKYDSLLYYIEIVDSALKLFACFKLTILSIFVNHFKFSIIGTY